MQKGNTIVSDYGRKFKSVCDKLAAIGQHVDDMDKTDGFFVALDLRLRLSPQLYVPQSHLVTP